MSALQFFARLGAVLGYLLQFIIFYRFIADTCYKSIHNNDVHHLGLVDYKKSSLEIKILKRWEQFYHYVLTITW